MIAGDKGVVVGRPYVKGASVKAEIISAMKAPKILVWKHQPKKAHEKVTGHRQQYSVIKIKEIVGG
jgi:large subunit ribosomal protein L21